MTVTIEQISKSGYYFYIEQDGISSIYDVGVCKEYNSGMCGHPLESNSYKLLSQAEKYYDMLIDRYTDDTSKFNSLESDLYDTVFFNKKFIVEDVTDILHDNGFELISADKNGFNYCFQVTDQNGENFVMDVEFEKGNGSKDIIVVDVKIESL